MTNTTPPKRDPKHFWVYLSLALSLILNLAGLASLAEGYVTWVSFLGDFVETYQRVIRDPLAWAGNVIWPDAWGTIPGWVFDVMVVWGGFLLAANFLYYFLQDQTVLSKYLNILKDGGFSHGLSKTLELIFLYPFLFIGWAANFDIALNERLPSVSGRRRTGRLFLMFLGGIVALFVVLLFINWQLQKLDKTSEAPAHTYVFTHKNTAHYVCA